VTSVKEDLREFQRAQRAARKATKAMPFGNAVPKPIRIFTAKVTTEGNTKDVELTTKTKE